MKQNQLTMTILSIVAIIVMVIPAYAVVSLESQTEINVLAVQGDYVNGTIIEIADEIDRDNADDTFDINIEITPFDANNDTVFMHEVSGFNDEGFYGNYITYIGNGSYTIIPDYTDNPEHTGSPATISRYLAIPLNITAQEIIDSDFIRMSIDYTYDVAHYLTFFDGSTTYRIPGQQLANNDTIWIVSLSLVSKLQSNPDTIIYLQIGSDVLDQLGDDEPTTITYKMESFVLSPADAMSIQDETKYFLTIFAMDVLFTLAFVFALEPFDIKFDKPNGNGKGKR